MKEIEKMEIENWKEDSCVAVLLDMYIYLLEEVVISIHSEMTSSGWKVKSETKESYSISARSHKQRRNSESNSSYLLPRKLHQIERTQL